MNVPAVQIRPIRLNECAAACELVVSLFDEFVAPDMDEAGHATFLRHVDADEMVQRMADGDHYAVAIADQQVVGVVGLRNVHHVYWLFVRGDHHRRGIARRLIEHAVEVVRSLDPDTERLTVKSSPFAVAAYRKMGFAVVGPEEIRDGIRATPMILRIAGRDPEAVKR